MTMRPVRPGVFLVAVAWLLVIASPGAQVASPVLTIVSPQEAAFVGGRTMLRARAEPAGEASSVIFYVDGLQVCALSRAPFECEWDAGVAVVEHQIRAVATFRGARHLVSTVRTKGLDYAESVDVRSVQLTATVSDNRGHFVKGLPKSSFRVFEDDRLQTISHFESEHVPLDLIVALDISGSMGPSMPALKRAATEFLTAVPRTNKVSLLAFNDTAFTLARGATDPAERIKAVDGLVSWGGTALYDVLVRGVDMFAAGTGRKALIVFSDGEDLGSGASLDEAEARLQASDVTLYMIGQGKGVELEPLKQVMHRLSNPTGGRPLFVERTDELRGAFKELLDELSNQYLLSYTPTNTRLDGGMRRIRVEIDGSYRVRARDSYRAPVEEPR
jgi:VWFA-related protein